MLLEQLLENLSVSIEAFATCRVAEGWRLRLPALDWVTFHFVVQGEGAVTDAHGATLPLPAGALAIVPSHHLHSLQCGAPPYGDAAPDSGRTDASGMGAHVAGPQEDEAFLVVCGRLQAVYGGGLGLFDHLHDVLVLDFTGDPAMRGTFEAMLREVQSDRPGARAMTSSLMVQCLIGVFRKLCAHERCELSWLQALDDPAMAPVLEAMLARPEDPHTVASLASKAFMSRSVFARRFKEAFGQPPLAYLRGVRLRHAARLLKKSPPLPVPTVASRSGFSSRSQFSRAFRSYFGCSPSEFRAEA